MNNIKNIQSKGDFTSQTSRVNLSNKNVLNIERHNKTALFKKRVRGLARCLGIVLFFVMIFCYSGYGQCLNEIKISKKTKVTELKNDGSIEVEIKGTGKYECQLVYYRGPEKKIKETIKGEGDNHIVFKNLTNEYLYRVVVQFDNEQSFLCKKRLIDSINLNEE